MKNLRIMKPVNCWGCVRYDIREKIQSQVYFMRRPKRPSRLPTVQLCQSLLPNSFPFFPLIPFSTVPISSPCSWIQFPIPQIFTRFTFHHWHDADLLPISMFFFFSMTLVINEGGEHLKKKHTLFLLWVASSCTLFIFFPIGKSSFLC